MDNILDLLLLDAHNIQTCIDKGHSPSAFVANMRKRIDKARAEAIKTPARVVYDEEGLFHVELKNVGISPLDLLLLRTIVGQTILQERDTADSIAKHQRLQALKRIAKTLEAGAQ